MRRLILCLTVLTLGLAACDAGGSRPIAEPPARDANNDRTFGSEAELADYLDGYADAYASESDGDDSSDNSSAGDEATAGAPAADGEASITNNQEQGVDEGDIVKAIGDHLVLLRMGRLYAASIAGIPTQTDTIRVARTDELNNDVWYDELLVSGDRLYVIGYRYSVPLAGDEYTGATEINSFRLVDGRFERLATSFLESWDYYSGDNYASRMVDGNLVFYMPFSAVSYWWEGDERPESQLRIPRRFRYDDATNTAINDGPLFDAAGVYRPIDRPSDPTYHSVVRCTLPEDGTLGCNTTTILGDYGRAFYVAPTDIFVWVSDHIVAIGLLDGQVRVHSATGYPQDQFAFRYADDVLHVATVGDDGGLRMLRLPISAFDATGDQSLDGLVTQLLDAGESSYTWITAERWIGDTFVAAIEDETYYEDDVTIAEDVARYESSSNFVTFDAATGTHAVAPTGDSVSRIENAGTDRAVIVSSTSEGLEMATYSVTGGSLVKLDAVSLGSAAEGESRSHGFFYRPDAEGNSGVFGLPVVQPNINEGYEDGYYYGDGTANVSFVNVEADGRLRQLGVVTSTGEQGYCETSCTDWYGNTRPIFYGDRVFALMGSELVEISVRPEVVRSGESLVFDVPVSSS